MHNFPTLKKKNGGKSTLRWTFVDVTVVIFFG
jgi:hypothetical protein